MNYASMIHKEKHMDYDAFVEGLRFHMGLEVCHNNVLAAVLDNGFEGTLVITARDMKDLVGQESAVIQIYFFMLYILDMVPGEKLYLDTYF